MIDCVPACVVFAWIIWLINLFLAIRLRIQCLFRDRLEITFHHKYVWIYNYKYLIRFILLQFDIMNYLLSIIFYSLNKWLLCLGNNYTFRNNENKQLPIHNLILKIWLLNIRYIDNMGKNQTGFIPIALNQVHNSLEIKVNDCVPNRHRSKG